MQAMPQNLSALLYADEAACVDALLKDLPWDAARSQRVHASAKSIVERVRAGKRKMGELESFLREYGLDTEEGLALMTLAEALLRIPDAATAHALIRDKMKAADWLAAQGDTKDLMMKAAGIGLSLTRKTLDSALSRLGEPVIRKAIVEALKMLGKQFVLGRTINEAIKNAAAYEKKGYRLSYDMLGEGARTAEDAERYFQSYVDALKAVGNHTHQGMKSGISVKLSALHPRYSAAQADRCLPVMTERLRDLAILAANYDVPMTVDAEEVDRLEISLQIIETVARAPQMKGWEGFGLAVQAYQKRCPVVIDRVITMAESANRRLQVRLVKGAYWDAEVKRAQVMGLSDYPVFTRKSNTDLSYIANARKLLERRDVLYPMLATHNAHSVAAVMELAGNNRGGFEFQRLHGMGESLHDLVLNDGMAGVSVYAPCGSHEDLLPYLVRRLLENGANSNFVNQMLDEKVHSDVVVSDPVLAAQNHTLKRHKNIPLPANIYGPGRRNSKGTDLSDDSTRRPLLAKIAAFDINLVKTETQDIDRAFEKAKAGYAAWSKTPANDRARVLEASADLMEEHTAELIALCTKEAGKTLDDGIAEVREAVDFCRYYAQRGRTDFDEAGERLPGPTGESNVMTLHGRGTFVCISPWNFPLAIFIGQIAAALMAGNAVIAKPAEQTPKIAAYAVTLMRKAGLPENVLLPVQGDGKTGATLVAHPGVAGVAFTGSTEVARLINRALAAKDGPIVPLIAETGGQNAMIIDSSALPEQIVDDVLTSAFGSAGQRCSALRVLFLQEDVADKIIHMLKGAMAERRVGNPLDYSTDIGPVIDGEALAMLNAHRQKLDRTGTLIAACPMDSSLSAHGHYFAPVAYEIKSIKDLEREVFGPVLHVIRYKAGELDQIIHDINATGYGLTFGLHTRIGSTIRRVTESMDVGNAYVNRTMIGAVVGVQPFGGQGLSGTGPKAGGPHYLYRFATEKVVSVDTTRQGGNATLVSLKE
ncbi:MAG: bifunctional proline dehydrogenase/L-glutamate gamma-semialdehyde dehydrogenase PutA [Micavibrio aeruginosavorus]|uniref:L-glutamate gamma-semialdehyde dehydrogenase n=1 Tax=Micavibrio aeruginosavorus TaxID=349221 RepID=A0A7T5R2G4_9BACT|nr:MAG: bifunctional proline dehydrogenase/L-glutamate gamma-semialdehyde dehydrogenase PutA [Micavibrio aeruginosavorus]